MSTKAVNSALKLFVAAFEAFPGVLVGLSLRLFPDPLLVVVVPKPVVVTAAVLQDILPAAVS